MALLINSFKKLAAHLGILLSCSFCAPAQPPKTVASFRVVGFFSCGDDLAHNSFIHEANRWFSQTARQSGFVYDSTDQWANLNPGFLSRYQVVIFLDARPDSSNQRKAFQDYMNHGGGWMGFHFAGFALTPSQVPQNWDWYHNEFLGSGSYVSNTWRPTAAVLRVEDSTHWATRGLPRKFISSPNEWYRWSKDLRLDSTIDILISIDSSSFPLGTGPKPYEIWHSGYYPVVWTNRKYRMIYFNMGHNDMDYEHGTNRTLSFTFDNKIQNRLILDALLWLGDTSKSAQSIHP